MCVSRSRGTCLLTTIEFSSRFTLDGLVKFFKAAAPISESETVRRKSLSSNRFCRARLSNSETLRSELAGSLMKAKLGLYTDFCLTKAEVADLNRGGNGCVEGVD